MTVDQALKVARKKHPSLRLGELICNAVALGYPEVGNPNISKEAQITEGRANPFSHDKQMEKVLIDLDKHMKKVLDSMGEKMEEVAEGFKKALTNPAGS